MEAIRAELKLFCDTYSTGMTVKHHVINSNLKVQISLEDLRRKEDLEEGETLKEPIYLSLYLEETTQLIGFLNRATSDLQERNPYHAQLE